MKLDRYQVKEHLKGSAQLAKGFALKTTEDVKAGMRFRQIQKKYEGLVINTN